MAARPAEAVGGLAAVSCAPVARAAVDVSRAGHTAAAVFRSLASGIADTATWRRLCPVSAVDELDNGAGGTNTPTTVADA